MATTELTTESTHEDIQNYVDEVVKNVETDRAGEDVQDKGDAQRVAEETDKPTGDMTAEAESGSDDTADKGEKTGKQDWLDADLKAEVAAYGIDEQELADFTSREELERALRFFDKSALEAGRKAMAESEGERVRDGKGRFVKQEPAPKSEPKEEKAPSGGYEIGLNKDVYEADLIGEFTRMRDHYESRFAALESRFMEADAQAEEQRFDGLVDSLGHADLFGKSGKESAKELERRQDLLVAVKAQQIGLEALGRPTDLNESLVSRVARMVFAEELGKKDLKAQTRKIAKQSSGRQGGGATRPVEPQESAREYARRLYKELESH